ncbi:cell division topological specificity factor MinE [Tissierella creatinophila]|uniref:Cell division topological specificity factor n=1 Tax=Tissierella creatinophila DSM 6911 TaxID=1123403 RepID=A0A1U7M7Y9_TISCR|nr:cell division topological specificity factor MinE [Tissierella creatinophila]OLS03329.1 cell division topological specificity factor [Tissierella creatinophila DSM 6911]
MEFLKIFGKKKEQSKNVAKERLKLVLVHDRSDLSPKFLDMIKTDIIRVISEYADIDEEGLDIKITKMKKDNNTTPVSALIANIPIIKVKDGSK